MRTKWYGLMLAATIGWTLTPARPSAAAVQEAGKPEVTPAAGKPEGPEIRPSTPEDEALKHMLTRRKSNKGITLSSGPPNRPHKVLGTVNVEAPADKAGTGGKTGPNLLLNELLRTKAIEKFGDKDVDGIMNIAYTPGDGKMKATGTVVHFEDTPDTGKANAGKPAPAPAAPGKADQKK